VKSITNTTFLLEIIIEAVAENTTIVAERATDIQNSRAYAQHNNKKWLRQETFPTELENLLQQEISGKISTY